MFDDSCPVCGCKEKVRIKTMGKVYKTRFCAGKHNKPIILYICLGCGTVYCENIEKFETLEDMEEADYDRK